MERQRARRYDKAFGDAAREAYERAGFRTQTEVATKAELDLSLVSRMLKGYPPGPGALVKWARVLGEPPERWLALAEGLPWESGKPASQQAPKIPSSVRVQITHPEPPEAVKRAIAQAQTNDEKVCLAWDYIRRPELGVKIGATGADPNSYTTRIALIRHYEAVTGITLLPPEVY